MIWKDHASSVLSSFNVLFHCQCVSDKVNFTQICSTEQPWKQALLQCLLQLLQALLNIVNNSFIHSNFTI